MLQLNELLYCENYLIECLSFGNQSKSSSSKDWSSYYCADYALLKIIRKDYVCAFDYIKQALKRNATCPYFSLIAVYLLSQLRIFEKEKAVFNANQLFIADKDKQLLTKSDLTHFEIKKQNGDCVNADDFNGRNSLASNYFGKNSKSVENDLKEMESIANKHESKFVKNYARNVAQWKNDQLIAKEQEISQNIEKLYIVNKHESREILIESMMEQEFGNVELTSEMEDVMNRCLFYYHNGKQCMDLKKFNHVKPYFKIIFAIISQVDISIVLLQCELILQNSLILKQKYQSQQELIHAHHRHAVGNHKSHINDSSDDSHGTHDDSDDSD